MQQPGVLDGSTGVDEDQLASTSSRAGALSSPLTLPDSASLPPSPWSWPCASDWTCLPPDILHSLSTMVSPATRITLMATCTAWNKSLKAQLTELSPMFLDTAYTASFSRVTALKAPLLRSQMHTFVQFLAPIRPDSWHHLAGFPCLTSLDLAQQALDATFLDSLPEHHPRLEVLILDRCRVTLASLTVCAARLPQLRVLSLAGAVLPDLNAQSSKKFLEALASCPHVSTLDLSIQSSLSTSRGATGALSRVSRRPQLLDQP